MDLHYKQEVTVGLLVTAGVGLFLAGTLWLQGTRFSSGEPEVRVAFTDAGTLKRGSAVRVSGVNLGSVDRIDFESVGKVVVTLKVSSKVAPKIDATAELASIGLVAEAVINYHPGSSSEPLPEGRVIQGSVDQGLMGIGTELGGQAKQALTGINEIANKRLADNLNKTLEALQQFTATFGARSAPVVELTKTMESLQRLSARLDSSMAQANLSGTLRKSDTLLSTLTGSTASFSLTAARLDTLLQRVNRGDGSLGKLMTDSLLYSDVRRVTQALEKLIDELRKNPGKITIQIKAF